MDFPFEQAESLSLFRDETADPINYDPIRLSLFV